jgi:nitrate/TMAO reductase-like tetraheme cytochrome c subunit
VVEAEPEAPAKKALPVLDDSEKDQAERAESSRAEEKRKAKVDLKEIRAKHEREKAGNA